MTIHRLIEICRKYHFYNLILNKEEVVYHVYHIVHSDFLHNNLIYYPFPKEYRYEIDEMREKGKKEAEELGEDYYSNEIYDSGEYLDPNPPLYRLDPDIQGLHLFYEKSYTCEYRGPRISIYKANRNGSFYLTNLNRNYKTMFGTRRIKCDSLDVFLNYLKSEHMKVIPHTALERLVLFEIRDKRVLSEIQEHRLYREYVKTTDYPKYNVLIDFLDVEDFLSKLVEKDLILLLDVYENIVLNRINITDYDFTCTFRGRVLGDIKYCEIYLRT